MTHIRWEKGGFARVASAEDDRVSLASTTPAAPGSRIDGALESGTKIRVKVARCQKQRQIEAEEQGATLFVIEGRLIDAARALRDEVAKLAPNEGSPAEGESRSG